MTKKLILTIFTLICSLTLPFSADAHKIINGNKYQTRTAIQTVEKYFLKNDNIKLEKELVILNVFGEKEFLKVLQNNNIKNAEQIAKSAQAVTSKSNLIIINTCNLNEDQYLFYLAHEMIHQYQHQILGNQFGNDMIYLEGSADILAGKIAGIYVDRKDLKIPYENIKNYKDYMDYPNPINKTLQARFYMKNIKSLAKKKN